MPQGTQTFIYIHAIWATLDRAKVLSPVLRKVLFPYLEQIAAAKGIHVTKSSGAEDHIHLLIKLTPFQHVADIVKQLKAISSDWLNESKFLQQPFDWENDYVVYSVSPSVIDKSVDYLCRQEEYHKTKSLEEELTAFEKMVIRI